MRGAARLLLATALASSTLAAPPPPRSRARSRRRKSAADALVAAAERFDVPALLEILGPDGKDLVGSGRRRARSEPGGRIRAAKRRTKLVVVPDPKDAKRVTLIDRQG